MAKCAWRWTATMLVLCVAFGCRGKRFSDDEIERGRKSLETSLTAWKRGEPLQQLRSLPEPIEFTEEMPAKGYRLLDFQILGHEHTDAEVIRFSVKLTLQDQYGRKEEKQYTYAIGLKSPIVIGRDPFF